MDAQAVLAASVENLAQLGLEQRGHVLCIKAEVMKGQGLLGSKENLASAIKKSSWDKTVSRKMPTITLLKGKIFKSDGSILLI